eukprot:645797-Prymnesium_polylepis.1
MDVIDPDMTSMHELLDNGMAALLGYVVNGSLAFPQGVVVPLQALADLLCKLGEVADNPSAFDLHALAVLPCNRKRFPKRGISAACTIRSCGRTRRTRAC